MIKTEQKDSWPAMEMKKNLLSLFYNKLVAPTNKKNIARICQDSLVFTFVFENPSPNKIISAMSVESGTTIEIGRNMDFKLSGSSVLPA